MTDKIALIDLDGTVANYSKALETRMRDLQTPDEVPYSTNRGDNEELPHEKARRKLIQRIPGFWSKLEKLPRGFEVVDELRRVGFSLHVLTQGPRSAPNAWAEKVEWCKVHLEDALVTVTRDKSLVYGRVLVDDYPSYFLKWLKVRPRGLVVCVAQPWNEGIEDPQVFRYTGDNRKLLRQVLRKAFQREGANG